MLSIAIDNAVQMLEAGWTVRYKKWDDSIEWRSPCGLGGDTWASESLNDPPKAAVAFATERGDIRHRPRA